MSRNFTLSKRFFLPCSFTILNFFNTRHPPRFPAIFSVWAFGALVACRIGSLSFGLSQAMIRPCVLGSAFLFPFPSPTIRDVSFVPAFSGLLFASFAEPFLLSIHASGLCGAGFSLPRFSPGLRESVFSSCDTLFSTGAADSLFSS